MDDARTTEQAREVWSGLSLIGGDGANGLTERTKAASVAGANQREELDMTPETKWTPGPWQKADGKPFIYALDGRGTNVFKLMVDVSYCQSSELEANANLIAQAPRMYDALDMFLSALKTSGVSNGAIRDAEDSAREVMAAARGETK